jgi:hypothetical protein
MATFQVPQFIDEAPKIIGFLTLAQFFYLAGAGAISFICFYVFTTFFWLLITIVLAGLAIALAFVKIGGQSFPKILINAFHFLWKPRQYTWQRMLPKTTLDLSQIEKLESIRKRMTIEDKLKTIALGISTGKLFSPNQIRNQNNEEKKQFQVVTYATGERKLAKRVDY